MSLRSRTWEVVEAAQAGDAASRAFDSVILSLIVLNVLAVIVGSVESIQQRIEQVQKSTDLDDAAKEEVQDRLKKAIEWLKIADVARQKRSSLQRQIDTVPSIDELKAKIPE